MTNLAKAPARTGAAPWKSTSTMDLSELAQARVEMINLVQWPARVANSYVSDDQAERTALQFHVGDAAFVTRSFEDNFALGIRLPTLQMQFLEGGTPTPHVFDPEEHSPAEAEAWILIELLHRGVDRSKFSTRLPYTIPGLMSGDAEDYSPQACQTGLTQLAALFQDAAAILEAAALVEGAETDMVCDPATLDLQTGSSRQGHRLGFAPGDAQHAEPYFYVCAEPGSRRPVVTAAALISESDPVAAAAKLRRLTAS
jgi:hypothetical protein